MKNVLVVGGLGYFGYELCKQIKMLGHTPIILDNDLYGKWEGESIPFETHSIDITKINDTDLSAIQNIDHIVFSAGISDEAFLVNKNTQKYCVAFVDGYKKISENFKDATKQLVTNRNSGVILRDFEMELYSAIDKPSFIPIPELFGISEAFRSDTFINRMILDFIVNKTFYLSGDPFEIVTVCEVTHFAKTVATNLFAPQSIIEEYSSAPTIMISNLVNYLLGLEEYQLQMELSANRKTDFCYEDGIMFNCERDITRFVTEFSRGLERGLSQELLEHQYDNKAQVESLIQAFKYMDKIK